VIAYRTNSAWSPTVVTAAREDGVATFTTVQPHGFRPGQKLTVSVASTPSFTGTVYVSSTPDATTLTAAQPGPNITGTGGSLNAQRLGGCLIGGTFYDATLFPASERGGYFFADFNSQSLVRSVPSGRTTVSSTDLWRYVGSEPVDLEVGPDGALYVLSYSGFFVRLRPSSPAQAVVLSNTHLWLPSGGTRTIGVSLAIAPTSDVVVDLTGSDGAPISVSPVALTFTPSDWSVPRAVVISAAASPNRALAKILAVRIF
jgi:hypothetical protein